MCFVGYNLDFKAYRLIEESTWKLIISQNMVFNEVVMKDYSTKIDTKGPKIDKEFINMELEDDDEVGVEKSNQ